MNSNYDEPLACINVLISPLEKWPKEDLQRNIEFMRAFRNHVCPRNRDEGTKG